MPDLTTTAVPASAQEVISTPVLKPERPKKNVHDWVRDMRLSAEVNQSTVGVETEQVTPELMLKTSEKLLNISRGKAEQDPKDSLLYQRFYGPAEYFAEHILRDAGQLGRSLLWKATNRGNVDFMQPAALDKHVSSVFYDSKLAQLADASSPLEQMDAAYKTTRIGEGGVADLRQAPDEMRLVQPSYMGFIDPCRSPERLRVGLDMYFSKNCMKGSDGKLYAKFINAHTGKEELVDSATASKSIVAASDMKDADTKSVFSIGGTYGCRIVPKSKVDYYLPYADEAYSTGSNMVSMMSGVKDMRLLMGCLHPDTLLFTQRDNRKLTIQTAKAMGSQALLPGCTSAGDTKTYEMRNSIAKFPDRKKSFYKVILKSGRSLITSDDHRWPILKDGAVELVKAAELKEGDVALRTTWKERPERKGFINGCWLTSDIAYLLGVICRGVSRSAKGHCRFTVPEQAHTRVLAGLAKLGVTEYYEYKAHNECTIIVRDEQLLHYIDTEIHVDEAHRTIPGMILTARKALVADFLDGYTADKTKVGIDSNQDVWVLFIPNMLVRDCLSMLFAQIGTDSLYRDAVRKTTTHLALKLIEQTPTFGDMIEDPVLKIMTVPAAAIMIDIDIDDNMYAVANGILTHNSKYPLQAISLEHREAPLVQPRDDRTGKSLSSLVGKYLGARFADRPGVVKAVRSDQIDVRYDDGEEAKLDIYRDFPMEAENTVGMYGNFPMNTKGFINNTPRVKAGQRFNKGDILASSNYTDEKGNSAIGTNLRTAWISWKGGTYEDAVVVSESAAKKLTSTVMYKSGVDLNNSIRTGKELYKTWKPGTLKPEQLDNLDNNGVVKPGTILQKGDPMILAIQTVEPSPGTLGKRLLTDVSETWEHTQPGVVTDVVQTKKGIKVYATVTAPAQVGDKVSGCYDDQTEIFTDHGFKPFSALTCDDLVATLGDDGTAYFTKPSNYITYGYNGPLYHFHNNKCIDLAVTPDHRMLYVPRYDREHLGSTTLIESRADELLAKQPRFYVRTAENEFVCFDTTTTDSTDKLDVEEYDGKVYCVTTETGRILVRRNGKACWCGNCYGNKGVISKVLPDDQMPQDKDGNAIDLCFSPLGLVSRTNASQLHEALLGKIAKKRGVPYVMPAFTEGKPYADYVDEQLRQYRVSDTDDLIDPTTGKKIPKVFNGVSYIYKLKHLANSKLAARGTDAYSADDTPSQGGYEGSKRYGTLELGALVGHGAFDVIQDAHQIRGQANSSFWRSIRTGEIPTMPGEPLVNKKFFNHLRGAGVNVRRTPKGISVFALSNQDVNELAGPRELRSKDTYDSKNYTPMPGGLFGQDIFGENGDKWAYIQLDTPLPNPVMEEPLARLLNMTEKQFTAVVAGKETVNGMSSAADIKKRLESINIKAESARALQVLQDAPKSKKDAALKRYRDIARLERNGVAPADYMLTRIPVLPPMYRPISSHNGLTMVADSNYLYAQMLDARDDMRDAQELPDEYKQEAAAKLYKSWKELTGLYEPENPKLQHKNVQGLLKWALGTTPKMSGFQRKLLGTAVDTVGRGTITPDSRLKLNELGIPEAMAFDIYAPLLTRKLVKSNVPLTEAVKMIKDRNPRARAELQELMKDRPVQMNRAPTLHKLGIMGFNPVLVAGDAVHINPSICIPFCADFDGDSVQTFTQITVDVRKRQNAISGKTEFCNSADLIVKHSGNQKKELAMLADGSKVEVLRGVCALKDLPVVENSEVRKSDTVTEWDVVDGYYVDTVDPTTGERVVAPIKKVSRHENLHMYDCTVSTHGRYSHCITASDDHSLITLNPMTLALEKTPPAEAVKRCIPKIRRSAANMAGTCAETITFDKKYPASHELGKLLGIIIGDGWVTQQRTNYDTMIACCHPQLQQEIIKLLTSEALNLPVRSAPRIYVYAADEKRFSRKNMQKINAHLGSAFSSALLAQIGHKAWNKRIPLECLLASRAHMSGVLVGLLASDGTVSYAENTTAKKSKAKTIMVHTTSPELRDSIQELCYRLNIRTAVTAYKGQHSKHTCYAVALSINDYVREYNKHKALLTIPHPEKQAALERMSEALKTGRDGDDYGELYYTVPFPQVLRPELSYAKAAPAQELTKGKNTGCVTLATAKRMVEALRAIDWSTYTTPAWCKDPELQHTAAEAQALVDKWCALVDNSDNVTWEQVTKVTESSCTTGWDCTVPGPYTFPTFMGTVVQDTVNVHLPISDAAVKNTRERMFPERNLISMANREVLYKPEKEYIEGLYLATRMNDDDKKAKQVFDTVEDARAALKSGAIDVDTPIEIKYPNKLIK